MLKALLVYANEIYICYYIMTLRFVWSKTPHFLHFACADGCSYWFSWAHHTALCVIPTESTHL